MIALTRDRIVVPAAFVGARRHANLMELFSAAAAGSLDDKDVKKRLYASSRWSGSKVQLVEETHGKCAFCEAPTSVAYYGDVEHFRPKSEYWWLAYCYDNYLYACARCNGSKSDQHVFSGVALPRPPVQPHMSETQLLLLATQYSPHPTPAAEVSAYEVLCRSEINALPNPYHEDPEALFAWEADDELAEVRVVAANDDPRTKAAMAAAEAIVSLNRPELLSQRYIQYRLAKKIHAISLPLPAEERQVLTQIIKDLTLPEVPFAGMMRFFARQWGVIT